MHAKVEYSHRYPVVKLFGHYYAIYRGTNKLYLLEKHKITEVTQLSNIFPYAVVSVSGKYLLITDCKGKDYYKFLNGRV